MTDELDIAAALYAGTDVILSGLGYGAATIDWGLPFTPPDQPTRYLEVRHFRNSPTGPNWDASDTQFAGIWQISVIDFTNEGPFPALALCKQIAEAFPQNREFWYGSTVVKIDKPPAVLTMIEDGHKHTYPVSVSYRCSA